MPTITTMPDVSQQPAPKSSDDIKRAVNERGRLEPKKKKKAPPAAKSDDSDKAFVDVARPCVYPDLVAELCFGANAVTERDAEIMLDWCSENQFQSRQMAKNPGTEKAQWAYNDVYMLIDAEKNKVRCLNNLDNRSFDPRWCGGLVQTILKWHWAGPTTISELVQYVYGKPGMQPWTAPDGKVYQVGELIQMAAGTINGSCIGLSRTARVESGQHTLCALKIANQLYHAAPRGTYPEWDAYLDEYAHLHDWGPNHLPGPVIETILVKGLSEDRRVLQSVDHCKPRTPADVFYTSDIFVSLRNYPAKRQEMSRMLQAAVELFWKRTKRSGYRTHSEIMQIVVDHPKLIKAVEHIFKENADVRRTTDGKVVGGYYISNLKLSPGQSACLMYLMGCSDSDGDEYRNGNPPREKELDFDAWDAAKEFWTLLGASPGFEPVRRQLLTKVIGSGTPEEIELTGGLAQRSKLCILAKAWKVWREEGRQFTELDLEEGGALFMNYSAAGTKHVPLSDGTMQVVSVPAMLLEDPADFGGIDVPENSGDDEGDTKPKTEEEMQKELDEIHLQRMRETEKQVEVSRSAQDAQPIAPKRRPQLTDVKPGLKGGVG